MFVLVTFTAHRNRLVGQCQKLQNPHYLQNFAETDENDFLQTAVIAKLCFIFRNAEAL